MQDEVLNFIRRRFIQDDLWLNGNCYYFAIILHERFPTSTIWYDCVVGHFVIFYHGNFYDWHGIYKPEKIEYMMQWDSIKETDPSYYKKIVRDVIY